MSVAAAGCEGSGEQAEARLAWGWLWSMSGGNQNLLLEEGGPWEERPQLSPGSLPALPPGAAGKLRHAEAERGKQN